MNSNYYSSVLDPHLDSGFGSLLRVALDLHFTAIDLVSTYLMNYRICFARKMLMKDLIENVIREDYQKY